jgi:hypothetical protein
MTLFAKKDEKEMYTLVSLQYDRYILLFPPRLKANVSFLQLIIFFISFIQ